MKNVLKATVVGIAMMGAVAANASPWTLYDGSGNVKAKDFTGIDWAINGTAIAKNYNDPANNLALLQVGGPSATFTMDYYAMAVSLTKDGGRIAASPSDAAGFDLGILASFQMVATCLANAANGVCTRAEYTMDTSQVSTYSIYYFDHYTDYSMMDSLAGFTSGANIINGVLGSMGSAIFTVNFDQATGEMIGGSGNVHMMGTASVVDSRYVNPADMGATIADSTLQLGNAVTDWIAPTSGFNPNDLVMQADGNQKFMDASKVPEPTSLALIGVALAGLGFARRRKAA